MLTNAEMTAMDFTAVLIGYMKEIMGGNQSFLGDWGEFIFHIHAIQNMILAQSAAREYPTKYRLLGEVI